MSEYFNRISEVTIFCVQCGHENPGKNRFCGMCGSPLRRPTVTTAKTVKDNGATAEVNAQSGQNTSAAPSKPAAVAAPPSPSPEMRSEPISGPSFLGLGLEPPRPSSGGRRVHYLLDEEEEPRGHGMLYATLLLLAILGGLGYYLWSTDNLNRDYFVALYEKAQQALNPQKPTPPASDQPANVDSSDASKNAAPQSGDAAQKNAAPGTQSTPSTPAGTGSQNSTAAAQAGAAPGAATGKSQGIVEQDIPAPGQPAAVQPKSPDAQSQPPAGVTPEAKSSKPTPPPNKEDAAATDEADKSSGAADDTADEEPASKPVPTAGRRATAKSSAATAARNSARSQDSANAALLTKADDYLYGHNVQQNCDQALTYLRQAVENNSVQARSRLGTLYATGHCVPQDRPAAYRWFAQALRQNRGNTAVEHNMEMLWNQMSPQEKQLAVKMSQ